MPSRRSPPRIVNTGVTRANIPRADDILEKRLLAGAREGSPTPEAPARRPLPEIYTEGDERRPNDIDCWHCMSEFETPPIFVPVYIKRLPDGRIQMGVLGNFCSYNCAAGHINRQYPRSSFQPHKHEMYHKHLLFLFKLLTGRNVFLIKAAPHFSDLLRFGGRLTAGEHIKVMQDLDPANHRCYRSGEVTVQPDRAGRTTAWQIEGIGATAAESSAAGGGGGAPADAAGDLASDSIGMDEVVSASSPAGTPAAASSDDDDLFADLFGEDCADPAPAERAAEKPAADPADDGDLLDDLLGSDSDSADPFEGL